MMATTISEAHTAIELAMRPAGLYRVVEAALMAGLDEETVRRRIRAGKVRAWGSPQRVILADLLPPYMPCRQK